MEQIVSYMPLTYAEWVCLAGERKKEEAQQGQEKVSQNIKRVWDRKKGIRDNVSS